jgi:hypothetical protein
MRIRVVRWALRLLEYCTVLSPFLPPPDEEQAAHWSQPVAPAALTGPPPGHPERVPPAGALSAEERALWAQLTGSTS